MELKKVQKQGREERTQEDYPTSAVYFCRCRVVFLRSFISALFLYFFQFHLYLKSSFTETFFPSTKWDCTRRELESLLGHPSQAVVAVQPGCHFLRQLFGVLQVVPKQLPPYSSQLCNESWFGMVVIFLTGVEWCLTLSPRATICTCLFSCNRFFWLWSSSSRWCMVQSWMAFLLVWEGDTV